MIPSPRKCWQNAAAFWRGGTGNGWAERQVTRILIDMPIQDAALARLDRSAVTVEIVEPADQPRLLDPGLIRDAEILFCTYPPKNLACMERLQWIQVSSAGYNQ